MNFLIKKFAHKYLTKIKIGTLKVTFPDGTYYNYGNNEEPKVNLKLYNMNFFTRIALYDDIGFAESYMDKDFDTDNLTKLIYLALINSTHLKIKSDDFKGFKKLNPFNIGNKIKHILRKNSKTKARKNISEHYDLSNDFFKLMLDDTMMYSAAVFNDKTSTLLEAQKNKIDILAKKLNLKKGSKVLEIGSGWGAMALHLASAYGCDVKTLTLSEEQKKLCEDRFKEHNYEKSIEVMLKDYRDMEGEFDAIISIEMFEAVGKEYFDIFFKKCESLLKPSGNLVMQIITMPDQRYEAYAKGSDFIQKYIFPGGHLPSVAKIIETISNHTDLHLLHMEEFTEHYAKTLNIWHDNFNKELSKVFDLGFDEYFVRMWRMYLSYCEAGFLTRNIHLVQLTFSRYNNITLNKGLIAS
jgi:cyclopropane-fatty-acyl-phospholipid synthase